MSNTVGAGCEKVGTGFSRRSRSKILELITYDFGLMQSKIIMIWAAQAALDLGV
jgi:hypothetical protein